MKRFEKIVVIGNEIRRGKRSSKRVILVRCLKGFENVVEPRQLNINFKSNKLLWVNLFYGCRF